jgi:hypothetical protein
VHEISTKQIGMMAVSLVLVLGACGGESVTGGLTGVTSGVTGPDPGPPPEFLAGTWRGGDGNVGLVWQLTQDGDSITGSSQIFGRGRTSAGGRVEGKVTGSAFTFSANYVVGTGSEAACTTKFEGTLTVQPVAGPPRTPPATWYPGDRREVDPPFQTTKEMFGRVSGNDCVGPIDTRIRLIRD